MTKSRDDDRGHRTTKLEGSHERIIDFRVGSFRHDDLASFAQDMPKDGGTTKAAVAPLKSLKGTVKADGDKLTFVTDKDQKAWDVANPEALKGHEGHHVQLSAHVMKTRVRFMS